MAVCPFARQDRRYDAAFSGRYTGGPAKGLLHTTETPGLPDYQGGATAPHFTAVPDSRARTVVPWQHYDTARPARALRNESGGVQTNNDTCIQIELAGTCDPAYFSRWRATYPGLIYWPQAPTWALDGVARLMRWIEQAHGIPRVSTTRPWLPYPRSYGSSNGQRMTPSEWDNFAGWCGHQHADENVHGDPGDINITYLLSGTQEDDVTPEDRQAIVDAVVAQRGPAIDGARTAAWNASQQSAAAAGWAAEAARAAQAGDALAAARAADQLRALAGVRGLVIDAAARAPRVNTRRYDTPGVDTYDALAAAPTYVDLSGQLLGAVATVDPAVVREAARAGAADAQPRAGTFTLGV